MDCRESLCRHSWSLRGWLLMLPLVPSSGATGSILLNHLFLYPFHCSYPYTVVLFNNMYVFFLQMQCVELRCHKIQILQYQCCNQRFPPGADSVGLPAENRIRESGPTVPWERIHYSGSGLREIWTSQEKSWFIVYWSFESSLVVTLTTATLPRVHFITAPNTINLH